MGTNRERARKVATEFVESVNKATACARCGAQPVEWHHPDHPQQPNSRVSSLRTQGASVARIQREMDRCEPLCRSCHMVEDGRSAALRLAAPLQKGVIYVPPRPCIECGRLAKPTRRDRCYGCYVRFMGIRPRRGFARESGVA